MTVALDQEQRYGGAAAVLLLGALALEAVAVIVWLSAAVLG